MERIEAIRKRQLKLALGIGIPYFAFVISIFMVVYMTGESITNVALMGFPLHYWLVAVAVYPITWVLFIWYVGKANRMEDEIEADLGGK